MVARAALLLYRLLAYVAFTASFTALILAATGLGLVPAIDRPASLPLPLAVAVDLALVLLFGVQHTIMARPAFKRALGRVLPTRTERSTFVLASSACVAAIALGWAPIDGDLVRVDGAPALALTALAGLGFGLAGASTFAFDHLELFGLRDAQGAPAFAVPALYRLVRHPMMLGMLVGFWASPHLTVGHALFAAALTAYTVVGVRFEERELVRTFGAAYRSYAATVPSLLPWPRPRAGAGP